MLVLSRKINETIVIDERITLEILQIKGNQIRIGINAPAHVRVLRGELKPYGIADPSDASNEAADPFDGSPEFVFETQSYKIAQVG
jgi:carbon storage regulator